MKPGKIPMLLGGLLSLLMAGLGPRDLQADGGTLRVANAVMGAYRVSVFTAPTPITPDSVDISVLATFERGRGVARELEILVVATLLDGSGTEIRHPATREQADDPRYYAAKFSPGALGEWEVLVRVRGPEGEGETSFRVEVREPGIFQNPVLILVVAFLPLLLAGTWLRMSSRPSSLSPRSNHPGD